MRDALSSPLVGLFTCPMGLLVPRGSPNRRRAKRNLTKRSLSGRRSPKAFAREPKSRLQLVGRFHHGSRESLSRTTFYPCRSKSEHHILHTPDGDSETAGEECPIYSDGELQKLTRGEYGHLQPTSVHVFLRLLPRIPSSRCCCLLCGYLFCLFEPGSLGHLPKSRILPKRYQ